MTAVLRYLYLKSVRDHSLVGFLALPALVPVSALLGVTLQSRHFRYPFFLSPEQTPAEAATLAALIAAVVCVLSATISAFWSLRPEFATRSISSFVLGVRPITIVGALIVFGAGVGLAATAIAILEVRLLTTSLPVPFGLFALTAVLTVIGGSAVGAFMVSVSPHPAMIVCAYFGCLVLASLLKHASSGTQLATGAAVAIACTVLAAFLLERRCAT